MAKLKKMKPQDDVSTQEDSKVSVKEKKEKDSTETKDKSAQLLKLRKGINDLYKSELLITGEDRMKIPSHYFSTGSFWLDYACGIGVPKGRFILLWGDESSLKSTLSYKIMADAQKRDRKTNEYIDEQAIAETHHYDVEAKMWKPDKKGLPEYENNVVGIVDIEGAYDENWASANGLDTSSIFYSAPSYGEQAVDLVTSLIESQLLDVILIDSIAMLSPQAETQQSSGDAIMGKHAILMNKACRVWTNAINKIEESYKKPLVIMINQLRQKIGVSWGSPDTVNGGKGQHFITSIEIRTRKGQVTYLDVDKQFPLWQEMSGTINKNKCAPPKINYAFNIAVNNYDPEGLEKAVYPIPFKKGDILEHKSVIEYASKMGLVGKDEEEKKFFIKPLGSEKIFYDKKGDLLNEWFYYDTSKYMRIKSDLLKILTGKK